MSATQDDARKHLQTLAGSLSPEEISRRLVLIE